MLKVLLLPIILFSFVFSCSPGPRRTLTQSEKLADMYWLYSKFDQNYAPREMKAKLHNFDYEKMKTDYLTKAMNTYSNEEFYQVMMQFVAEFKDAHTSADIPISNLPGRSKLAYLGFSGKRIKNYYKVTKLLPSIVDGSKYPIKENDKILKVDGVELLEFIDKNLTKNRNLGQTQSNYTALMSKIFTRRSYFETFPKKQDVELVIDRDGEEMTVVLPWIVKDFYVFRDEQTRATEQANIKTYGQDYKLRISKDDYKKIESLASLVAIDAISLEQVRSIISRTKDFDDIFKIVYQGLGANFGDHFRKPEEIDAWTFVDLMEKYLTPSDSASDPMVAMASERYIPTPSHHVPHTSTYKAYTTMMDDSSGDKIKVGVIRIHSFSPGGDEQEVISEFKKTLQYFMDFGVKNVVIDLLDNGGGSLTLGMQLAQAMTSKKLNLPTIELKINETWLDRFENNSINGKSDSEKEIAKRAFDKMLESSNKNNILSQDFPIKSLYPFQQIVNSDLVVDEKEYEFKYLLLTNELCASMCDIFSGIFQDNNLGKIMGSQTMGAGGNVTSHMQAPNSGLIVRQTESLLKRSRDKKDYIENNGIVPDISIEPYNMKESLYYEVFEKAFDYFKGEKDSEIKELEDTKKIQIEDSTVADS